MTKLTRHLKFRNQINIIEILKTKLKYGIKYEDQIHSLPFNILVVDMFITRDTIQNNQILTDSSFQLIWIDYQNIVLQI